MSGQMPLDLGQRPALGRDDFLVGDSNREAVAWIDAWPEWRTPGVVIWGPTQSGKSHLAAVWRGRAGATLIDAAALTEAQVPDLLGDAKAVVVERAQSAPEHALLHLYNQIVERRGHILLTAEAPPNRWHIALPDLRSRLAALPAVQIGPPDDALFAAIIIKLFADRQVMVTSDVVDYLAVRLERSAAAAAAAVAAIDRAALVARRPISVAMVREAIGRPE